MVEATVASPVTCSVCGESLGEGELCVACLLRVGLDDAGNGIDETRYGDFAIERHNEGSLWELGRGAMGVTYRALDTVLNRTVALKIIEPPKGAGSGGMRERFLREARAAAALRHPNIAGVFQFGASPGSDRCYCAMELVEGETLEALVRRDGAIDVKLAIEVGAQVTKALIAAAERGLVHRDLKPGNIMLAQRGRGPVEVKVIDFGLAKAVTAGAGEMELTHGGFVGTPAFASPEQFTGSTVDSRSDIYALGVTLWFALTGRLPFGGSTIDEVRKRQQEQAPPVEQLRANGVPARLIEILRTCLALDPTERPSPGELLPRLEACLSPRPSRRALAYAAALVLLVVAPLLLWRSAEQQAPSLSSSSVGKGVAVLPFENLSVNGDDAFLANGIQDDILNSLAKIKDLKVIARTSVADYRGRYERGKVRAIGQSLGISHVVEGSVRHNGDKLVLSVALIDTRDERQVWSERYERSMSDILSLQGELAVEIARALHSQLTPLESAATATKPTENSEAYLAYLRGRDKEMKRGDYGGAMPFYEQAFALDPGFALARARYSMAASMVSYSDNPTVREKARAEADEALRLQPNLGEARLALAQWYVFGERDLKRALEELDRASELLPNSAEVQLAAAIIYKRQKKLRERLAALRRAEVLDPRNQHVQSFLVLTTRWVRDWREAIHAAERRGIGGGPAYLISRWMRANDEFRLTGDLEVLKRAVAEEEKEGTEPAAQLNYERYEIASLERDYTKAEKPLSEIPVDAFELNSGGTAALFAIAQHQKEFHEALLAVASGRDPVAKNEAFERARQALRPLIQPPDGRIRAKALADLAVIEAFAGHKDEAFQNAQHAIEMCPEEWSWIERNDKSAALALVYAQVGEADKAIDLIEYLLTVPIELQDGEVYNMTLTDLRWRWVWDPLRSHPRFQKLLAGPEPKTIY